jgi:hypothetical protein
MLVANRDGINFGGEYKMSEEELLEIAQKLGYDQKNSEGFEEYKAQISKMDLWDRSKVLFFGEKWEKY